jgi:asparaginyl-tRNA synthetase
MTRRHLTEFLHAECEWTGVMTLEEHCNKLTDLMKGTISRFLKYGKQYLDELQLSERVEKILSMCDEIQVITHREAVDYCHEHLIYKDDETKTHFTYEDDIPEMQERKMIDQIGKIVYLTKFPTKQKSFYMLRDPDNPDVVLGVDVEAPMIDGIGSVGEIIGSGIRVFDEKELIDRLNKQGLNVDHYREYIDMRKYGAGRTSGCGLGTDRLLTWLLGAFSIRDVCTFPRFPGKLTP